MAAFYLSESDNVIQMNTPKKGNHTSLFGKIRMFSYPSERRCLKFYLSFIARQQSSDTCMTMIALFQRGTWRNLRALHAISVAIKFTLVAFADAFLTYSKFYDFHLYPVFRPCFRVICVKRVFDKQ